MKISAKAAAVTFLLILAIHGVADAQLNYPYFRTSTHQRRKQSGTRSPYRHLEYWCLDTAARIPRFRLELSLRIQAKWKLHHALPIDRFQRQRQRIHDSRDNTPSTNSVARFRWLCRGTSRHPHYRFSTTCCSWKMTMIS